MTKNQNQQKHNDTVKIIPIDGLMDIDPPLSTKVLPVSLHAVSNTFLVQCSVSFVSGQFLSSVFGVFPFGVWKLEVFFGSAVTDNAVLMAQGTSSCTTNCHQEWSQRLKGTH